ncbi:MAG: hypothetical protein A3I07_03335 [Candidatus Doudnabacteria bacterium RIFCSPLOWO2_02_FULL_42_9]|uniref:Uncharacterized protein n=1 Tax=Candidatus Doudnabacteria bacterium RIFCSPHIGHO2_01_FULL_41_86 TaxID=1817821 RepID=A0A1F5N7W7_9BACT|nr:MAG: hypothetical protein A2717_03925 [Candidatus Doudnabacteria bacterium RIFCSPHIGHO2_01_FULL_41_86]OGE74929.1 MAG: hypothetical protein A3K07_02440 [Candidatus Doudnabacteria bacterium RIFCSPHIGHO2_01_43_10]OGE85783.1 MAG: hypothetical protein A3E28_03255 [Candidatus Doudnabacteria bacterium RIFCSPHIGHO2_12_FULL_42_22]OGE87278.1 MAG: hypothetical protein A3C49_00880 [Candidatus Doudnabacteria bacterium RIFCSPHIGHO2_02_FULL_42_25]OGE92115.1 MAG: hypothetical protein A2895_00755 [Candidatus
MAIDEHQIEKLLKSLPKNQVPLFDTKKIRTYVLDHIALPQPEPSKSWGFMPILRFGAGTIAGLFIVMSLMMGTAVAALESVPGSAIYPLKRVVENIQLKLTPNDQKTNLQLKFANNRIVELQEVLEQKEEGKISDEQASTIVANTVKDIQKTTAAAVANSTTTKSASVANKLADISNKLLAASVKSEGQVKIELEKAIESTQISQAEAIANIENAGLKVENSPIAIEETITASGKLTAVTTDSVSIGTAKFLLDDETKFVGFTQIELKAGLVVDIVGKIEDNITYATEIKLVIEIPESDTTDETQ